MSEKKSRELKENDGTNHVNKLESTPLVHFYMNFNDSFLHRRRRRLLLFLI